jgi:phospholipid/cholesterol/gamma-HCH transport system substrate-binding protein
MSETPPLARRPEQLERRAGALLLLLLVIVVGSVLYVLYARGVFEPTQRLVLLADDSEGVSVGMDLTYSGFPVGRVTRIELADDGGVRFLIDVPRRDARWLRTGSVFTMSRGLVGGTSLRAYTGNLADPPLPPDAQRRVLAGDATAEIPKLMAQVRELLANFTTLTTSEGALAATLANAQTLTEKMVGPQGALGVLFGQPEEARKLTQLLDRTSLLLTRLDTLVQSTDGLVKRTDGVVARAGEQVFGEQGLARDTQAAVQQVRGLLNDARASLTKVDAILQEAHTTAKNVSGASNDLGRLRDDVEHSLRRVDGLVNEINRQWPFQRDTEVKLP